MKNRKSGQLLIEHMGRMKPIHKGNLESKNLQESIKVENFLTESEMKGVRENGDLYLVGIIQAADTLNGNGRIYPRPILEKEVARFKKQVIGENGGYGHNQHPDCIIETDKPEILTKYGWKRISEVNVGDSVYTYNTKSDSMELQNTTKVVNEFYSGDVYNIKGKNIDLTVTPNHRFYMKDRKGEGYFVTAEDLYDNQTRHGHSSIPKLANWEGEHPEYYEIPALDDSFYKHNHHMFKPEYRSPLKIKTSIFTKFLGIWLAEGHVGKDHTSNNSVTITQNEGTTANRIRDLFKELPFSVTERVRMNEFGSKNIQFTFNSPQLANYLRGLGDVYSKYIPHDVKQLSTSLLSDLYEWYHMGDGRTANGQKNIFSISEKMMDDFQEVQLKIQKTGNIVKRKPVDRYIGNRLIEAKNSRSLHILYHNVTKGMYLRPGVVTIRKKRYEGNVSCVSVPNSTFYSRVNGKVVLTGNSEDIDIREISHRMVDVWWDGNNVMGKIQVLHNTPGQDLRNLITMDGMNPGISSRAVGSIHEDYNGNTIVEEDLNIICWDMVVTPSTPSAYMMQETYNSKMYESTNTKTDDRTKDVRVKSLLEDIVRG